MNSQQDGYFINLLQEGSNLGEHHGMESQYLNENTPTLAQESQCTAEMGTLSKKPQRGINFTIEEDKLLVSAWLNISMDAIQGNEQKRSTYWQRVWEFFHEHKTFVSNRNENSLMNWWSTIQLSMNKFCGCYAQIESLNQSGQTEEDKICKAKTMYQELKKSTFQFEHCWNMLRHQPKWVVESEKKNQSKRPRNWDNFFSFYSGFDKSREDDLPPNTFIEMDRPIGRKAAKERLNKRKNNESAHLAITKVMEDIKEDKKKMIEKKIEMIDKVYVQEQEKLRMTQEKHEVELFKEDERIILMDLSDLPEIQQEFYRARQMEIIKKRRLNY